MQTDASLRMLASKQVEPTPGRTCGGPPLTLAPSGFLQWVLDHLFSSRTYVTGTRMESVGFARSESLGAPLSRGESQDMGAVVGWRTPLDADWMSLGADWLSRLPRSLETPTTLPRSTAPEMSMFLFGMLSMTALNELLGGRRAWR